MQFKLSTILIVFVGLSIVLAFFVLVAPGPRSILLGYDHSRHRLYREIQINSKAITAVQLLGQPVEKAEYFPRQLSAFELDVPAEKREAASQFWTWRNGGNWFYCIGIDDNNLIVFKIEGHS